jgi:hypothetical protein
MRGNEFEVVAYVGADDVIRLATLVEERNMNGLPDLQVLDKVEVKKEVVDLSRKILDKRQVEQYDFKQFKDTRAKVEEQIIEDIVLHGKVPDMKRAMVEQKEDDEVARLQALMNE